MAADQRKPGIMRRMRGAMMKHMPLMITCVEFETFILDYLEGTLPARQRRIFDLHLKMCRECRDYLAAYKATMGVAKRALKDPADGPPDDAPEELIKAVLAARER